MTTDHTTATRSTAMTDTDHDTAAVLTEAEREDFLRNLRQNLGYRAFVIEDTMLGHVERIAAGAVVRLAAQPSQDDPQPDEREALARAWSEGYREGYHDTGGPNPYGPALAEPTPGSEVAGR